MGNPQMTVAVEGYGGWQTVTVAKDGTVSTPADLGRDYEFLNIILPALDSTTIGLQVSQSIEGTYQTLGIGSNVTAATTGQVTTTLELGGFQFVKVVCGSAQTTALRTILVRGYRG